MFVILAVTHNTCKALSVDIRQSYVPNVFLDYVADVDVDGKYVELALLDTAGQEKFDRLQPLAYPNSDVIMICFAVDSAETLENVQDKVSHWKGS